MILPDSGRIFVKPKELLIHGSFDLGLWSFLGAGAWSIVWVVLQDSHHSKIALPPERHCFYFKDVKKSVRSESGSFFLLVISIVENILSTQP